MRLDYPTCNSYSGWQKDEHLCDLQKSLFLDIDTLVDWKNKIPQGPEIPNHILENIEILLSDPKINYNPVDYQGFTPLIKACASQAYDVVKAFLRSNEININFQDKIGNMALHYLCEDEKFDIAIELIKKGGDVKIQNNEGKTPLDLIKNDDVKSIITSYLKKKEEE